jgi:hypothetical protein
VDRLYHTFRQIRVRTVPIPVFLATQLFEPHQLTTISKKMRRISAFSSSTGILRTTRQRNESRNKGRGDRMTGDHCAPAGVHVSLVDIAFIEIGG